MMLELTGAGLSSYRVKSIDISLFRNVFSILKTSPQHSQHYDLDFNEPFYNSICRPFHSTCLRSFVLYQDKP